MRRQGWTQKPCHGCGSTEEHRKDKLCGDCQHIFNDGLLAAQKQKLCHDKIMVVHEKAYHMNSGPFIFEHSAEFFGHLFNDRLRHNWHNLLMSLIEPAVGEKDWRTPIPLITNKKQTWGVSKEFLPHDDDYYLIELGIRDKLNDLDLSIRLAMEYVYLAGRKQGLSILTGLNEGRVSLSLFDQELSAVQDKLNQIRKYVEEEHSTKNVAKGKGE